MPAKEPSIRTILVLSFFVGTGMFSALSAPVEAAEKLTIKSIVEGAKKEGKVSWGTNLEEHEVQKLHQAFQRVSLYQGSLLQPASRRGERGAQHSGNASGHFRF